MKKLGLSVLALLAAVSLAWATPKLSLHRKGTSKAFTGEIMDSQCAMMGSHAQMEKMHPMIHNAKQCTLQCVKMGGKFVLYNKGTKTTYQLDDQEKPKAFAGEKVKVTGTYDAATKTIHVVSIRKAVL